jgi:hypothetical protein
MRGDTDTDKEKYDRQTGEALGIFQSIASRFRKRVPIVSTHHVPSLPTFTTHLHHPGSSSVYSFFDVSGFKASFGRK